MAIVLKEDKPRVPEGRYKVRLMKHMQQHGKFGPGIKLMFRVLSPKKYKGEEVNCVVWKNVDNDTGEAYISIGSPQHKLLAGLNGGDEDIAGMKIKPLWDGIYYVEVEHVEAKDGTIWAQVTEISEDEEGSTEEDEPKKKKKKKDEDEDGDETEETEEGEEEEEPKKKKKKKEVEEEDGGEEEEEEEEPKKKKKKKDDEEDDFGDIKKKKKKKKEVEEEEDE